MSYTSVFFGFPTTIVSDFTSWIDIPPPKYFLSTFPNPIDLRPGDNTPITAILKSTTGSIYIVTRFIIPHNTIIRIYSKDSSIINSSGIYPATFEIKVPDQIQPGEYIIPVTTTIKTSSLPPAEFIYGGAERFKNSYTLSNTTANITIDVLKPFDLNERFKNFWDVWGQPITLIAGGFAAGLASLTFDRIRNKKKVKYKKLG